MIEPRSPTISFADFEIDTIRRRLTRSGETISLHAKAFDLLVFLATQNGRLVTKDELLHEVWDDRFVEESNLAVQISNLRKALGETASSPRFLVTVPGKGYKFVAEQTPAEFTVERLTVAELTIEQSETVITSGGRFAGWKLAVGSFAAVLAVVVILGLSSYWPRNAASATPRQPKMTKLTSSGKVATATITPDGKFAVFSIREDNGESLWLRQIESGSETRIVEEKPIEYVGLTVSPDNQYIFATVFSKNEIDPSVVKIPLIGGLGVTIPNVSTGSSVAISPDGKRFAFTSSNNGENETMFGIANIDGSNVRILMRAKHDARYLTMFQSSPVAWSANGDIALAVHEKIGPAPGHAILLIDPETGSEKYLSDARWQNLEDLAWIDSDRLAFIASEENGLQDQIWVLSRKTGEARRITNDLRSYFWLGTSGQKLLTVQLSSFSSLRVGELDTERTTLTSREILSVSEYVDELDWMLDGSIVYAARTGGTSELWRMEADGTNQRQLTNGANVTFGIGVARDKGHIVFASKTNGKRGIWTAEKDGQSLRMLSDGPDQAPDVSAAGRLVFHRGIGFSEGIYTVADDEPTPRLLREKCYFPAISDDGRMAACYFMELGQERKWRIALVSTADGSLIRTLDLPVPIYQRQIRFHPDGKHLTQIFWTGNNLKLLMLPLDGSQATVVDGLGKGTSHVAEWSADGKRFLYPVITETQDIMQITDF